MVGQDPGSLLYVAGKHRDCREVGIESIRVDLPAEATQADAAAVDRLNADVRCTAYIVQLPLPRGLDELAIIKRIDPAKDADGLHPANLGRLVLGTEGPLPCTPAGIVELLRWYDIPLDGANVCVDGRGITVGRSLGLLLTRRAENATVTLCHTGTRDLAAHTRAADIVIAAAGSPGLVRLEMIQPGAVVVDVGVSRGPDGKVAGDVERAEERALAQVTPHTECSTPCTRATVCGAVRLRPLTPSRTVRFTSRPSDMKGFGVTAGEVIEHVMVLGTGCPVRSIARNEHLLLSPAHPHGAVQAVA